jgi:hypothetical protein
MSAELYIYIHPELVDSPEDILADFPFEPGQTLRSVRGDLIVVDLGSYEDSNEIQDWYLNRLDEVLSFYVVGD